MAGGRGEAEIRTSYPIIEDNKFSPLVPEKSNVLKKEKVGLDDEN